MCCYHKQQISRTPFQPIGMHYIVLPSVRGVVEYVTPLLAPHVIDFIGGMLIGYPICLVINQRQTP